MQNVEFATTNVDAIVVIVATAIVIAIVAVVMSDSGVHVSGSGYYWRCWYESRRLPLTGTTQSDAVNVLQLLHMTLNK